MVDLSETYSNNYSIIREYVKEYRPTSVKSSIDPNVTDVSYSPNSTVKVIKQQQKNALGGANSNYYPQISARRIDLQTCKGIWLP